MKVNKYNIEHKNNKNHMTISINAEKSFDKFQYFFLIKIPKETRKIKNVPEQNKVYT
jgi:hypothetical protein